jgi:signal transduction histidine kinase
VVLERRGEEVVLMIEDDGHGFERTPTGENNPLGIGLLGMEERACIAGGRLEVTSAPGEGTTISVRVPLKVAEEGVV